MKIQLDQAEIETAVKTYLGNEYNITSPNIEFDFTAGRGDRGLTVDVNITSAAKKADAPAAAEGSARKTNESASTGNASNAQGTERVNGKVVATSTGRATANDEVANAGNDAGLDEVDEASAPQTDADAEEAPARAGGSIFGTM